VAKKQQGYYYPPVIGFISFGHNWFNLNPIW